MNDSPFTHSFLIAHPYLLVSSDQSLPLHPLRDNAIDLLRLLPKQPVRSIDGLSTELRNVRSHLVGELIRDDEVAEGPHEQSRAFDLGAVFDRQQGLVGFVVGLAVAVVVACGWLLGHGYEV